MNSNHYILFTLMSLFSASAISANLSNPLQISSTVESKCFISIPNLNFGELIFSKSGDSFTINNTGGTNVIVASTNLNMMCNKDTPITYSFSGANLNNDNYPPPIDIDGISKRAFAMKNNKSTLFYYLITNFDNQSNTTWGPITPSTDFAHFFDGSIAISEIFNPNYNQRIIKALVAPSINPYFPTAGEYSDIITMKLDF